MGRVGVGASDTAHVAREFRGPRSPTRWSQCASGATVVSVALTRCTARFGELASAVDAELERRGAHISAAVLDRALNARVDHSAQLLGVGPRAALRYAPPELPAWLAAELTPDDGEPDSEATVIDFVSWKHNAVNRGRH